MEFLKKILIHKEGIHFEGYLFLYNKIEAQ